MLWLASQNLLQIYNGTTKQKKSIIKKRQKHNKRQYNYTKKSNSIDFSWVGNLGYEVWKLDISSLTYYS